MTTLTYYTELAAVEAAFAEPKRTPPIGDFAREMDSYVSDFDPPLSMDKFKQFLDEYAQDHIGEWLENMSESRLQHYTGLTDAICDRLSLRETHFDQLAAHLYATCLEFKCEYAHKVHSRIIGQMLRARRDYRYDTTGHV